ncbi:MAG: UDP-N-acetylmuramate dehydrogenase [Planctomycetota bacterium]|nr:MAG: UDP-N-acetylmuramate dehydrogenase [Planctomycetota bacterium]
MIYPKIDGVRFQTNIPLSRYTTYGVGASAHILAQPTTIQACQKLLQWLRQSQLPYLFWGGGSNILFGDQPYLGLVLRTTDLNQARWGTDFCILQAGVPTPKAVHQAAQYGLSGLECLAGIPGTIGGAVAMNAGGKYGCIAERIQWVKWIDLNGKLHITSNLNFGYRTSHIPGLIVEAKLQLKTSSCEHVKNKTKQILLEKKIHQPFGEKSAGCIFKNPPGQSAGKIIDQLGLKGVQYGGAMISKIHANFILNHNNATANDIYHLIYFVQNCVLKKRKILLQPEVKILGYGFPQNKILAA